MKINEHCKDVHILLRKRHQGSASAEIIWDESAILNIAAAMTDRSGEDQAETIESALGIIADDLSVCSYYTVQEAIEYAGDPSNPYDFAVRAALMDIEEEAAV